MSSFLCRLIFENMENMKKRKKKDTDSYPLVPGSHLTGAPENVFLELDHPVPRYPSGIFLGLANPVKQYLLNFSLESVEHFC